jgi:NACHT domain
MSLSQQLVALIGGIVGIVGTIIASIFTMLGYRLTHADTNETSPAHSSAYQAVDQLAGAVQRQWHDEEVHRRISDPFPLPVKWNTPPERLFDHWSNILLTPSAASPSPLNLEGGYEDIVEIYERIPSRRLVILGGAGSGKTILAMRFVLDFLARRSENDPIPVIFSIASWDPAAASLQEWITNRLVNDYPGLGAPALQEPTTAAELVNAGRILPVLDGFDEITERLRITALVTLNATETPLILTSRLREYSEAVGTARALSKAAAISLVPLTTEDLSRYLPRTAAKIDTQDNQITTNWDPVIARLRNPTTAEEEMLNTVLSSPLMVSLARIIYSDSRFRDPDELLHGEPLATREAIEEHLLDAFIPAAYQHSVIVQTTHRRWQRYALQAQTWLENLAVRLERLETTDLEWWRLRDTIALPTRILAAGLVGLIGGGFLLWPIWKSGFGLGIGLGFGIGIAIIREGRQPMHTGLQFSGRKIYVLRAALSGATGGVIGGELGGLLTGFHGFLIDSLTGPFKGLSTVSPAGFAIGLVTGFIFTQVATFQQAGIGTWRPHSHQIAPEWLMLPLKCAAMGLLIGLLGGAALGLTGGLVLGTAGGLSTGLITGLETAIDVRASPGPLDLLRADRANAVFISLVYGCTIGLSVGVVTGITAGPVRGLTLGIGFGLMDAIGGALGFSAWGQWLVFTRSGLALTGQLPPAVAYFLADAHRRGVLRQAGAVYQFRHALLQHHLANRATKRRSDRHTNEAVAGTTPTSPSSGSSTGPS